MRRIIYISLLIFLGITKLFAQADYGKIQGDLYLEKDSIEFEEINLTLVLLKSDSVMRYFHADNKGKFVLDSVPFGNYKLVVRSVFIEKIVWPFQLNQKYFYVGKIKLDKKYKDVEEVVVTGEKESFGITRLRSVEGTAIYEGKKNEVIQMKDMDVNTSINSARQIFSKVPGVNIWESDAAGIQLGIATRGLDPNRTSNFNMKQNGYDMSADALGYPEAYYIPPAEGIERIEIIRGAASLQYGPQFGGLINYVLKKGPADKKIAFNTSNTIGAYGLFNTYNSLGGTIGKMNYSTFYQFKTGNGWRPNTKFDVHTCFVGLQFKLHEKFTLKSDFTFNYYLNQQPGGLTDAMFATDPSQSLRSRNWFESTWRIFSLSADWKPDARNIVNIRNWLFWGDRKALGFLFNINRPDDLTSNREMISDEYLNFGSEGRYLRKYSLGNQISSLLVGYRYYHGNTKKEQGMANNGTGPEFQFLNPDNLESSSFRFPGNNFSLFAENIFTISSKLTITPGVRWEYLDTKSEGYYKQKYGLNVYRRDTIQQKERNFLLFGIGISYYLNKNVEMYFNGSTNYRGITFTDMRVVSDAYKIDPNLKDESGYNIDLGVRGNIWPWFAMDASVFYLAYNDRIGSTLERDSAYNIYRLTTNVGQSRSFGFESYFEADFFRAAKKHTKLGHLVLFASVAYVNARYTNSNIKAIAGKLVEFSPEWMLRGGITFKYKKWSSTIQYSYVTKQYSDATNAEKEPLSIAGVIPAYHVGDISINYEWKLLKFSGGVNNFTNNKYFTRRAVSYPGPGIIPAEPITFYLSVGITLK